MRIAAGLVLIAGLILIALGWSENWSTANAQPAAGFPASQGSGLSVFATTIGNVQQVTVVDSSTQVMSIYQVDAQTGQIKLKCVRNIQWDLQMDEFNGATPSPREIRALLQQR